MTKKLLLISLIIGATIIIAVVYFLKVPEANPSGALTSPQVDIEATTTVSATYKDSPSSPDVILQQTYTAEVNGESITVPISPSAGTSNGTTGTITQTIDLTDIVSSIQQAEEVTAKEKFKKNWEVSTGLGVHERDVYIPVELQRNYTASKAISFEIHLDTSRNPKVTGGELKHTWKF